MSDNKIQPGDNELIKISTVDQLADIFTKELIRITFERLRKTFSESFQGSRIALSLDKELISRGSIVVI